MIHSVLRTADIDGQVVFKGHLHAGMAEHLLEFFGFEPGKVGRVGAHGRSERVRGDGSLRPFDLDTCACGGRLEVMEESVPEVPVLVQLGEDIFSVIRQLLKDGVEQDCCPFGKGHTPVFTGFGGCAGLVTNPEYAFFHIHVVRLQHLGFFATHTCEVDSVEYLPVGFDCRGKGPEMAVTCFLLLEAELHEDCLELIERDAERGFLGYAHTWISLEGVCADEVAAHGPGECSVDHGEFVVEGGCGVAGMGKPPVLVCVHDGVIEFAGEEPFTFGRVGEEPTEPVESFGVGLFCAFSPLVLVVLKESVEDLEGSEGAGFLLHGRQEVGADLEGELVEDVGRYGHSAAEIVFGDGYEGCKALRLVFSGVAGVAAVSYVCLCAVGDGVVLDKPRLGCAVGGVPLSQFERCHNSLRDVLVGTNSAQIQFNDCMLVIFSSPGQAVISGSVLILSSATTFPYLPWFFSLSIVSRRRCQGLVSALRCAVLWHSWHKFGTN